MTLPAPSTERVSIRPNPLGRDWLALYAVRLDADRHPAESPAVRIAALLRTAGEGRKAAAWRHLPSTVPAGMTAPSAVTPRSAAADRTPRRGVRISELLVAQSRALDAAAGREPGHGVRTAYIALRLAEVLGRSDATRRDVIHAALLKDLGGLPELTSLARMLADQPIDVAPERVPQARELRGLVRLAHEATAHLPLVVRGVRLASLVHMHLGWQRGLHGVRYRRGAGLAARIGFSQSVTDAIAATGERWDGRGSPLGLSGIGVPEVARLVAVASTADEMLTRKGPAGAERGLRMRAGGQLDPTFARLAADTGRLGLWRELDTPELADRLLALEPDGLVRYGEPGLARRLKSATRRIGRLAESAGVDLAFHGYTAHRERGFGAAG